MLLNALIVTGSRSYFFSL